VKDINDDLLADSHTLSRQKNYFYQLLNVQNIDHKGHTEMHTAWSQVSEKVFVRLQLLLKS